MLLWKGKDYHVCHALTPSTRRIATELVLWFQRVVLLSFHLKKERVEVLEALSQGRQNRRMTCRSDGDFFQASMSLISELLF
jgi:hypothetical protein